MYFRLSVVYDSLDAFALLGEYRGVTLMNTNDMSKQETTQILGAIGELHEVIQTLASHIDERFAVVDSRFDAIDRRFDGVDHSIALLRTDMNTGFMRLNDKTDLVAVKLLDKKVFAESDTQEVVRIKPWETGR